MKKFFVFICVSLMSSMVFATTLSYTADFTQMKNTDPTMLDICGFPVNFKMDAAAPLASTFIKELFTYGSISLEEIQATEGSMHGGGLHPAYSGDYREKVYIVKQVLPDGAYSPGIYTRVQVNTYGSKTAPSGFIVNSQLLNHYYSAEMAEGAFCGDIYYKLD